MLIGPGGSTPGKPASAPALPKVKWYPKEAQFTAVVGADLEGYPVFYDVKNRIVHFNQSHPQFATQINFYVTVWPKDKKRTRIAKWVPSVAEDCVKEAYEEIVLGIVLQTLREVRAHDERERELSADVLKVAVRGYMNVIRLIEEKVASRAEEARRTGGSSIAA